MNYPPPLPKPGESIAKKSLEDAKAVVEGQKKALRNMETK